MSGRLHETFQQLIGSPKFESVARLCSNRSWIAYLPSLYKEQEKQAVLQWLLSPSEGHGQGDYFLKALLRAVFEQIDDVADRLLGSSHYHAMTGSERLNFLNCSYSSAVVAQEFRADGKGGAAGWIDLIVVDPVNMVVLLIERKDGSSVHGNQLAKYREYARSEFSDYYVFPVILDSYGKDHSGPKAGYLELDDGWLIEAVDEILESPHLPPDLRWSFGAMLNYVFAEEWREEREGPYEGYQRKLRDFAKGNRETLGQLARNGCRHEVPNGSDLSVDGAGYHDLVRALGRVRTEHTGAELSTVHAHAVYYSAVYELLQFDQLEPVVEEIQRKWPSLFTHTYAWKGYGRIEMTCRDGLGSYTVESDIWWPIWLDIAPEVAMRENVELEGRSSELAPITYRVSVGASLYSPAELHPLAREFVDLWGFGGLKRNWKRARQERLMGVATLDLDSNSALSGEISKFCELASKAVGNVKR